MTDGHITPSPDDLSFFVTFEDGDRYAIDLREFALGSASEVNHISIRKASRQYRGRPIFARQFSAFLRDTSHQKTSTRRFRLGLREFFRFLDDDESNGGPQIDDLSMVTDAHGEAYLHSLSPNHRTNYRCVKAVIDAMRDFHKMEKLAWPPREHDIPTREEVLRPEAARALYQVAKRECRQFKAQLKEGQRLADLGSMAGTTKAHAEHWSRAENRAHLISVATSERLLSRPELEARGYYYILSDFPGPIPSYLPPTPNSFLSLSGWSASMRWFYPAFADITVLLWLVVLGTGWNLSTVLALDISEEKKWFFRHPTNPNFVVLHSYKKRAKKRQLAFSMTSPEFHPYRILKYVIEITHKLRETLKHALDEAVALHSDAPSPAHAATIAELRRSVRSPWLYITKDLGRVSVVQDGYPLSAVIRDASQRQGKTGSYPELSSVSISQPRDTWIQYAYVKSGYHVLIAQLAAFHKTSRTTAHYLKLTQLRAQSEKAVRRLQNALVGELISGQLVDPTRLKILLERGAITDEQHKRLLDYRMRTRLGTGCLDPYAPPRTVAPEHTEGSLCRVQRCLDCPHCFIFAESLDGLCRSYAELIHIQRNIPLSAWVSSSFADEHSSIAEALKLFASEDVTERVSHWTAQLRSGNAYAHDTYPSY